MDNRSALVLLDNGSSRAQSTLSLRKIAAALGERVGNPVHPVSLMHADRVPADALDGRSADTFEPFLRARVRAGERKFLVLPLFFGPSRTLTDFLPAKVALLRAELGPLDLGIADVLCPLPGGEPRLTPILRDNVARCASDGGFAPRRVVLVDHGSPTPEVTAVRSRLAEDLRLHLGKGVRLGEAVMERRAGARYDFNGPLLLDALRRLAEEEHEGPVILSMLFLFAGRHAGPGGDVERICGRLEQEHPGFRIRQSALVGDHPGLVDILRSRFESALRRQAPARAG